jgi:hypothetical protein
MLLAAIIVPAFIAGGAAGLIIATVGILSMLWAWVLLCVRKDTPWRKAFIGTNWQLTIAVAAYLILAPMSVTVGLVLAVLCAITLVVYFVTDGRANAQPSPMIQLDNQ